MPLEYKVAGGAWLTRWQDFFETSISRIIRIMQKNILGHSTSDNEK